MLWKTSHVLLATLELMRLRFSTSAWKDLGGGLFSHGEIILFAITVQLELLELLEAVGEFRTHY